MTVIPGQIIFFNNLKGWGLLTATIKEEGPEGGNYEKQEVFFVHWRDVSCPSFTRAKKPSKFKTFKPGQTVTFIPSPPENNSKLRTAKSIFCLDTSSKIKAAEKEEPVMYGGD